MRLSLIALLAVGALAGWLWYGDHRAQTMIAPVASLVAGREVTVQCQSLPAALIDIKPRHGEVQFSADGTPEARIFLIHATCKRLVGFSRRARHPELDCLRGVDWSTAEAWRAVYGCGEETTRTVFALQTLAHEAYHTAGVRDEKATNCFAAQALAFTATAFGGPEEEALLAARAMAALLPVQGTTYGTGECVHGGGYDLHPETPAFPTELPIRAPLGEGGRPGLARGAR